MARATAVVIAGGQGDGLATTAGVAAKALVPFRGEPLGRYVLKALAQSETVDTVVYVGKTSGALAADGIETAQEGKNVADSLRSGFEHAERVSANERFLIVTPDLPWLTAEAVDDFVMNAAEADVVFPVVERAVAEAAFPDQQRTYVRLQDGVFTGGNLALVRRSATGRLLPFIDRLYQARKNPLRLAGIVGPGILVKLLLKRLRLYDIEKRASRLLDGDGRVYISPYASLAADIDKPAHLATTAPLPAASDPQ